MNADGNKINLKKVRMLITGLWVLFSAIGAIFYLYDDIASFSREYPQMKRHEVMEKVTGRPYYEIHRDIRERCQAAQRSSESERKAYLDNCNRPTTKYKDWMPNLNEEVRARLHTEYLQKQFREKRECEATAPTQSIIAGSYEINTCIRDEERRIISQLERPIQVGFRTAIQTLATEIVKRTVKFTQQNSTPVIVALGIIILPPLIGWPLVMRWIPSGLRKIRGWLYK